MNNLTHIDLFSGIGGFALAAKWAGFETKLFCEIDPFCQKVLKKHWPDVPIVEDIKKLDGTKYTGATLLTGGFPCQPFSVAGKRRGKEDDRYLWPEMLRVISEARPTWVIGENVAGIKNMEFHKMLSELEGIQYQTQTLIIPACSVNAQHRRDRMWIIANTSGLRCNTEGAKQPLSGVGEYGEALPVDVTNADSGRFKECRYKPRSSNELTSMLQWPTESPVCGTTNGVSGWVDRLRALGNAIVPQVAYEIIKCIAEIQGQGLD